MPGVVLHVVKRWMFRRFLFTVAIGSRNSVYGLECFAHGQWHSEIRETLCTYCVWINLSCPWYNYINPRVICSNTRSLLKVYCRSVGDEEYNWSRKYERKYFTYVRFCDFPSKDSKNMFETVGRIFHMAGGWSAWPESLSARGIIRFLLERSISYRCSRCVDSLIWGDKYRCDTSPKQTAHGGPMASG